LLHFLQKLYRLLRAFGRQGSGQIPASQAYEGPVHLQGQSHLRQRSHLTGQGDHGIGALDDDDISGLTHAGDDGDIHKGIGLLSLAGQNSYGHAPALMGSPAGRLHHPSPSAGEEDVALPG